MCRKLLIVSLVTALLVSNWRRPAEAARHALLIACSNYESQADLPGCGIDVALLRNKISSPRFGFQKSDVTVLSDADASTPVPTYKNICQAFDEVARGEWATDPDPDVVLIYLSGHGGQKPSETEPDGMDEYFMPIDEDEVILDDQIGIWLAQLQQKQIHVWIVFDSCFCGTMSRGSDPNEVVRGIPTSGGVIPQGNQNVGWELPKIADGEAPAFVAFYACQAHERALEDGALEKSINGEPIPHGLFSYCLLQCLEQESPPEKALTYEDLHRRIIDRYRALGRTWPTPFCEGNLNKEVFGFTEWPSSNPLRLVRTGDVVELAGGSLAGLTPNAIVAIFDRADGKKEAPLGYVQAQSVTAVNAQITSIALAEIKEATPLAELPENGICRIVSQELGELRIPLSVGSINAGRLSDASFTRVKQEFSALMADAKSIFRLSETRAAQGWSLLFSESGERVLVPNPAILSSGDSFPTAEQLDQCVHVLYPKTLGPSALVEAVASDLRKVYNCENLQRLAAAYGENSLAEHEIKLRMKKSRGDINSNEMRPGDVLEFEIINESTSGCAYAAFIITSNYHIVHESAGFVRPAPSILRPTVYPLFELQLTEKMRGLNSVVLVAIPLSGPIQEQLRYEGLAQSGLGVTASQKRGFVPANPFEEQLYEATFGNKKVRTGNAPEQPQMSMASWVMAK